MHRSASRRAALALALALALGPAAAPAQSGTAPAAEAATTLVMNLTTDDVWTSQMALGLAERIADDGGSVVIFLNVRAVALASTRVAPATAGLSGRTAHEALAALMAKGVRVFVCPACTTQAGLSLDDRVEGTEPGSAEFRRILMAPGTRIMSY